MAESDKLRVPDPETTESVDLYDGTLVLSASITLALGIGFFLARMPEGSEVRGGDASGVQSTESSDLSPLGRTHRRVEREVEGLERDELVEREWSSDELVAVFRYGGRTLAEAGCLNVRDRIADDELDRRVRSELFGIVDRRASQAPYACLLTIHLDDELPEDGSLVDEFDVIWNQLQSFSFAETLTFSILQAYESFVPPPSSEEFWRWVRLCSLDFRQPEDAVCRKLVRDRYDDEVDDLLELLEHHLRSVDSLNTNYDVVHLLRSLERLAGEGQPTDWRIRETKEIPDYDGDLRVGASFYLCRFLQSPNQSVVERTAEALSGAAGVSVRAVDRNLVPRWRRACEQAFGERNDEGQWDADAIAVWTGEPDDPPIYRLAHAVEIGQCEPQDPEPLWYCGVERWNGDEPGDLLEYFVDTRGLEWDDPSKTITKTPASPE